MTQLRLIIQKKAKVDGKGVLNNRISEYILTSLSQMWDKNSS